MEDINRETSRKTCYRTLGFRGLLDRPFWNDDLNINDDSSDEVKAKFINEVIAEQYKLIKEIRGNKNPLISAIVFGPETSLFDKGLIKYPEDCMIQVGDAGNVVILPSTWERAAKLPYKGGIYQHVSYHNGRSTLRINTIKPELVYN